MPFPLLIPLALSAASAIGGALGKKKPQPQVSTTTPTIDPAFRGIQDMLVKNTMERLSRPSALPAGISERNTADINRTYGLADQSLQNRLTASGLAQSPIAGAGQRYLQGGRASEIVRMKQTLPIMEHDWQNQDLASALALLTAGRGQTTTTTGGAGTGQSALGGGISGLASMLGFLAGQGMFGGQQSPGRFWPEWGVSGPVAPM